MNKLALVPISDTAPRLLLRKAAAARRIGTNRMYFDELVRAGVIAYVVHPGRTEKLYPIEDLDAYVASLKRCRMGPRESQLVALEGVK